MTHLLDRSEALAALRLKSPSSLYDLTSRREIESIIVGRRNRRWLAESIESYIERQRSA